LNAGTDGLGGASRQLRQSFARAGFSLRRTFSSLRLRPADRLLIAPQELEAGDPSIAVSFYSGHITLAGRTVATRGVSPFAVEAPSAAWAHELHGFSWLRHFRDADNMVVRHHARALVAEWLKLRELRTSPVAQNPGVVASRMIAWLVHAPLLLADADHGYYNRFMRSLARDARWLDLSARRRKLGMTRLTAAIALNTYSLCANTADGDWQKCRALLAAALKDLVLADGTPISRNPEDALDLTARLLQLRTAYTTRGRTPPPELQTTLDRSMSFLRLLRHRDGAIALFNGMGSYSLGLVGALLAFDDAGSETPASARFGGYHRLERGETVVIVDAGSGPPLEASDQAHAGALSFEFSAARERIVVNCGAAAAGLDDLREALRETAAHSTLTLGEESSARFRSYLTADDTRRRRMVDIAPRPKVERDSNADGEALSAGHEGYLKRFGVAHNRTFLLESTGNRLTGLDQLTGTAGGAPPAVLRFHLHPRVIPELDAGRQAVRLRLGEGSAWTFEAGGLALALEESIFLGGLASQRRTQQIVVAVPNGTGEIRWSFARQTA
jgi:uncharacterized heparinase superfamily protein